MERILIIEDEIVIRRALSKLLKREGYEVFEVGSVAEGEENHNLDSFHLIIADLRLPGGFGTLEEVLEILTWAQLGFHSKPCGLFNIEGYFDHLLCFLDHAAEQRFVRREHRDMLMVAETAEKLVGQFRRFSMPVVEKWLDRQG